MDIAGKTRGIISSIPKNVTLVVVTKTQQAEKIMEVYDAGYKIFGENKVQELLEKYETLPKDIQWHLIGHLQTNKVKYIAPFVHLIHSVDSLKLLQEIDKQALRNNRGIDCLLQIHIAQEETKFGFDFNEAEQIINANQLKNVSIVGLMGMATNTNNEEQIKSEFHSLKSFFDKLKSQTQNPLFQILSMGMSSDYKIAIKEGSTMVRIGSSIFGARG
jgi:PLP dependent protein